MFKPNKIIVHCSATPDGMTVSIPAIKKDHLARGFKDIGYHKIIQPDGFIADGCPETGPGTHCKGENESSYAICLAGSDEFHPVQLRTLLSLLRKKCAELSIPKWEVYTHNYFDSARSQGKTCPGFKSTELVHALATDSLDALKGAIINE